MRSAAKTNFSFSVLAAAGAAAVLLIFSGLILTALVNREREIEPALVTVEQTPGLTVKDSPPENDIQEKDAGERSPSEATDKSIIHEKPEAANDKNQRTENAKKKSGRQPTPSVLRNELARNENAQRLQEQIEELTAISKQARGGVKIVEEFKESAVSQKPQNVSEAVLALIQLTEGAPLEEDIKLPGTEETVKEEILRGLSTNSDAMSKSFNFNSQNETYGALISPNKTYVRSNRITFTWPQVANAANYSFRIGSLKSKLVAEPIYDKNVAGAKLTDAFKLSPNQTYVWQARPLDKEGRKLSGTIKGTFKTLPAAAVKRVKAAESKYAKSPLKLGVIYARNGLLDEAVKQFNRYAAENPKAANINLLLRLVEELRSGQSPL